MDLKNIHTYIDAELDVDVWTHTRQPVAMSTSSDQIVVSKYHPPLKGTLEKWLIQKYKTTLGQQVPERKEMLKER